MMLLLGGQMKRLSIGVEIINLPDIIYLDGNITINTNIYCIVCDVSNKALCLSIYVYTMLLYIMYVYLSMYVCMHRGDYWPR
jgi:hypothetical protein